MSNFDIDFGEEASTASETVQPLFDRLKKEGIEPGFITSEIFCDINFNDQFLNQFPAEEQYQYLKNTSLFESKLKKDNWLSAAGEPNTMFGAETVAPEISKANGAIIPPESGKVIEIDNLREAGIDTSKVLIFRATQPSDQSKPEYYWTTDYFETKKGLSAEMGESNRKTAIILVSNLEQICEGGAIKDKNDDNGLSLRRIDMSSYDQKTALGKITP